MAKIDKKSIEKAKENIRESLEDYFIENINSVKDEMNLLNLLIESFTRKKYTYDEYCRCRMKFETEACEKALDFDLYEELKITDQEMTIIQNISTRKSMNPSIDYDDTLKEEYVKWQLEKFQTLDKKMFYQIIKYSLIKLLKKKISKEVWNDKENYFYDICEDRAIKSGEEAAASHKNKHEEEIRYLVNLNE